MITEVVISPRGHGYGGEGGGGFDQSSDQVSSQGHQCPIKRTDHLITQGGRRRIVGRLLSGPPWRKRGYEGCTLKAPRYELLFICRRTRTRPLFSRVFWCSRNQNLILEIPRPSPTSQGYPDPRAHFFTTSVFKKCDGTRSRRSSSTRTPRSCTRRIPVW